LQPFFKYTVGMNLDALLNQYKNDNRIISISDRLTMSEAILTPPPPPLHLNGLLGSSREFVFHMFTSLPESSKWNHLVILRDAEEAAYFQNTIEQISGALDVFYFPSSFKHQKNFKLLNASHVMLRTEALSRIGTGGNKKVLITYPQAFAEKVVLPKILAKNIISFKKGNKVNLNELLERFINYGFKRTDFVYEPGEIALRGGILDIYSYGNEKPYRIELFGEEVDSIRLFDPQTQLSEKMLSEVNIIPNIETNFDSEQKVSLLSYMPENTVCWIEDWEFIKERIEKQESELNQFLKGEDVAVVHEESDETQYERDVTTDDFMTAAELQNELQQHYLVEIGLKKYFSKENEIQFSTSRQPAFNRQFTFLISDLKKYKSGNYSIYIFAENPRQLERLHSIFTDQGSQIEFIPVIASIHEGFIDHDIKCVCYSDHEIFQRYHKYHIKQAFSKNKALTLKMLRELQPGDYVTHIDHGVGMFSGLQKIETNGVMQEAVRIVYKDHDLLYVNISSLHKISKYSGKEGTVPKLNKLGSDVWNKLKDKTKKQVRDIAKDLISLYAKRKSEKGFQHNPDGYMQHELEASFIYEDTPDQSKAVADVKKDMENESPMDRLICGDVGFGKTEVAIRAAFKTCLNGKQAAILVPTTILAYQHYKTFKERLAEFPVKIDYLNRFKSAKQKKETLEDLKEGKIDIIIGTHALLGKNVRFKDLGLLVVDEEQKFGVSAKERLKQIRTTVDTLTLTATPIPRTLQFSLMGARDLSIINTPPPNRQPIQTELRTFNADFIREAIYFEVERGGQVFFIQNRVKGLQEVKTMIQELCPDLKIASAHGKMEGSDLENTVLDFIDGKYDVLVCTNIIESGVDIPNVNTIIINNAHQFGLSDLHQLRGRVGRSNKKAFCYLIAPPMSSLPDDSRKRLTTLEQYSDLGSGFQIAMRDLDIRGAGNLLGGEQSGFIAEIGFEMYHKILDEAIRELKRNEFREVFKEEIQKQEDYVSDCTIDTDLEVLLPDEYVESVTERLSLYSRLDQCYTEEELTALHKEMEDRFGPVPAVAEDLFTTVRCRKLAVELGFEKIVLKNAHLRCFFISNPDSPYFTSETFEGILNFIQTGTNKAKLKQSGKLGMLIVDGVHDISELFDFLSRMHKHLSRVTVS